MKLTEFSDFLPEFYKNKVQLVAGGGTIPVDDPDLLRYAAIHYCGELFVELPRTVAPPSRQLELSEYIKSLGFKSIVPRLSLMNDKAVETGSLLLYHEGLDIMAIQGQWGDNFHLSCKYSSLEQAKVLCNKIYKKFSVENREDEIVNIIRLDVDKRREVLYEYRYDPIKGQDDRIIKTYDFNDEVLRAIKLGRPGILIFHGKPGTGKSSYIRWLAQMNPDKEFALFSMISLMNEGGIRFLTRYLTRRFSVSTENFLKKPKDLVIILEDSEKILQSRENPGCGTSAMTSELLNLIDGAGPERDRVKFIFTFNMKVSKVDPALLRKGRLLKSIEFKELTGDTLVKVATEFGVTLSDHEKRTGLTVADLVYHDENTGIKSRESIGFK